MIMMLVFLALTILAGVTAVAVLDSDPGEE